MARNSAGTHSLPAATNPVVTGTTGTSTWANGTMSDLSTEITDSLSRSGKGGMLAPMRVADGSVAAPAHSFTGETGSGWFRESAGVLKLAILGVYRIAVTATLTTINSAASVLGTLLVSGKITGSAGAAVTGTLEVVDDGGTLKKVSLNAPTGLAADYALDLPAALPAATSFLTMTSAGAIGTSQLVSLTAAGATQTAVTGVGNTTGSGVLGTGGATDGLGVLGNGGATNGIGVKGLGAGTGLGVQGLGGAAGGHGVAGTGGSTTGAGVVGQGGTTSGVGVSATGGGSGAGLAASSSTGPAAILTGNATSAPLRLIPQAAPSSLANGDIWIDSGTNEVRVRINGATYTLTKV